MAKDSPKRQAAVEQIATLRSQGAKDKDIRVLMSRYQLSEAQLDELLPTTAEGAESQEPPKAPKAVAKTEPGLSGEHREHVSECIDFLRGMVARVGDPNMDRRMAAQDLRLWAERLRRVL